MRYRWYCYIVDCWDRERRGKLERRGEGDAIASIQQKVQLNKEKADWRSRNTNKNE